METISDKEAEAMRLILTGPTFQEPTLKFKKIHDLAQLPSRANPHDAGLDLVGLDRVTIPPGGRAEVHTGLKVAIPYMHGGFILPRSGNARKYGVTLANAPGLIDSGYRGELILMVQNLGDRDFEVHPGDRLAQLVVVPILLHKAAFVEELEVSDGRGDGGWGSSGR